MRAPMGDDATTKPSPPRLFGRELPAWTARIPIDLVVLLAIAILVVVTHRPYIRRGMCFNDPSWYFHFGQRALAGDVPYRDYIFQVGPLPVYVDAAFQSIFGSKYIASMYAALFIKIIRIFVAWSIARRLANRPAAALLIIFCAFDPLFSFAHHWSTHYAQLFFTLAGLFFVLASRNEGRRALLYLALAGCSAALVVSARQSSAVMIGVTLLGATAILTWRKEYFTRQRFIALWAGFAGGLILVFGVLAIAGAAGDAIQQMFLDAPAKKGVHGVAAILDAISGGALVAGPDFKWWSGFLVFLGAPCLVVGLSVYIASRKGELSAGATGMMIVPIALLVGFYTRYSTLAFFSDVPRIFLSVTVAFAVLAPARLRTWFGLEPLVAIGLGALPLASDWALEMSFPGRGWGDAPALVVGTILVSLASTRIPLRVKTALCAALAVAGLTHVIVLLRAGYNPFAKDTAGDGSLAETRFKVRNPATAGLVINESRKKALEWMQSQVTPNSSCFVYANLPVLYTLLDCRNPTRVDSTAADFITADDANTAIATLRANPPDFIIAHEKSWMSPPLTLDLEGKLEHYDGLNPKASHALHIGLRSLLADYESVGTVAEAIGPELTKQAALQWDLIDATRIYRRK
jgi:hypothetical protein